MITVEASGAVGWIRLDRPERANAYDDAHLHQLDAAITALAGQTVVLLTATGRSFCGGADLGELETRRAQRDWKTALNLRSQRVFTRLARAPFVSVASVQGPAIAGGFELAMACDLRVVGPTARFALPETSLGIVPSAGGLTRLARLCGVSVAKGVILGGGVLDAPDAMRLGLAHRLGSDDDARSLAETLATRDPRALRAAKERLDATESDLTLLLERSAQAGLYPRNTTARSG